MKKTSESYISAKNVLMFQGKNSSPFPKLIFQMAEVVFFWYVEYDRVIKIFGCLWCFFISGSSSWMLLLFTFLIACSVGVKLFVSGENLFVISIEVVFSNRFLRRADRRGINNLCWFWDVTDSVVVVSLYFTLQSYFGNVAKFLFLNIPQSVR